MGVLPTQLGLLYALETLKVDNNTDLGGNIPTEICNLQKLKNFTFGGTEINTTVPKQCCDDFGVVLKYCPTKAPTKAPAPGTTTIITVIVTKAPTQAPTPVPTPAPTLCLNRLFLTTEELRAALISVSENPGADNPIFTEYCAIELWNVGNLTSLDGVFTGLSGIDFNLNLWDTSRVTSMRGKAQICGKPPPLRLSLSLSLYCSLSLTLFFFKTLFCFFHLL
jgi:hypothetical protein